MTLYTLVTQMFAECFILQLCTLQAELLQSFLDKSVKRKATYLGKIKATPGQEKTIKIQLPRRPVHFSFHLPSLKSACPIGMHECLLKQLPVLYLSGTVYNQVCFDFKLIHAFNSLICSSCSLKFWNCFLLEMIRNKTAEVNFTCLPDHQTSIFTCSSVKFTCPGQ